MPIISTIGVTRSSSGRLSYVFLAYLLVTITLSAEAWHMTPRRASSRRLHATPIAQTPKATIDEPSTADTIAVDDLMSQMQSLPHLPKLIVFDLDNTLWTPELYQIRTFPRANHDIRLFEDVAPILRACHESNITLGIASRTNKIQWAKNLLQDFKIDLSTSSMSVGKKRNIPMDDDTTTTTNTTISDDTSVSSLASLFAFVEIEPGSKITHFNRIKQASGCEYSEMMFIDDDARLNLQEISTRLGVLCLHTPAGITLEHFRQGLQSFHDKKEQQYREGSAVWMGDIISLASSTTTTTTTTRMGRVKFYSPQKKFGFVVDHDSGTEYFVHESKVPVDIKLEKGDVVAFEALGNNMERASAVVTSRVRRETIASTNKPSLIRNTIPMSCFTMSQPFCSLLLNGVKTIESRNNPMFMDVKPGSTLLVHCGQRDWHDVQSYKTYLLADNTMTTQQVQEASTLPINFVKGAIVGKIIVGKTWKASEAERMGRSLQRQVLAPYEGIGMYCTEIVSSQWLERPVQMRGQPGIYSVQVPSDVLGHD
jgi:magnesium-dependent phosphatase 1